MMLSAGFSHLAFIENACTHPSCNGWQNITFLVGCGTSVMHSLVLPIVVCIDVIESKQFYFILCVDCSN